MNETNFLTFSKAPFICSKCRMKATCKLRYGTDAPLQSKEVKEKMVKTFTEKYGVEYACQTKTVKEKIRKTNEKKYGNACSLHGNNEQKTKTAFLKKYGVDNPWKSKEIRKKIMNTNEMLYGVKYPMQSKVIRSKRVSHIEYDGLFFDSGVELKVYKYCKDLGLSVKYQPCSFKYTDSLGRTHTYFPDFEIGGQLYEVKGKHLWKNGHVWFPYRNTLTEESLKEIDARDLAKTECMRANKVKVVLSNEVKDFLEKLQ